jgi:hypothetical protein
MNRRGFLSGVAGLGATLSLPSGLLLGEDARLTASPGRSVKKIKDVLVYQDERFYSAFPSVVRRPDGELLVAFRRAPERRLVGATVWEHVDPNSQLVLVRSRDAGETWTKDPELIYAHPFGGSQDPCMVQLRDYTIICTSYGWMQMTPAGLEDRPHLHRAGDYGFLGGFMMKSIDGGKTWAGPIVPPSLPGMMTVDPFDKPLPSYNRGAMCEGRDGKLYWVVCSMDPGPNQTHLLISSDAGTIWEYSCLVAKDDKISFNETSLYETPAGDLVAFMRTDHDRHAMVARSRDKGRSFEPWQDTGFRGIPQHLAPLPDGRVLLVYGYRSPPYEIRARVLNPECSDWAEAEEITLRSGAGNRDIGYPWATALDGDRALVVYYFNLADKTRFIAGTILEV